MNKKRINFLVGNLILRKQRTGVHLYYENLLKQMIKQKDIRWDITISCYAKKMDIEKVYPEYKNLIYKKYIKFSGKIVRVLAYFLPIEIFFKKSDIYICDGLIPVTINKSYKIAVIHDLMSKIYPENYSIKMKLYLGYYYYRCKKADCIIAVSETTKADIVKYLGINENKIKIVYNGFDFDNVRKSQTRDDEKIDYNKKYLLYMGDMRKNKNLISAIKGFEIALKNNDKLFFYIAGAKKNEYKRLYEYVVSQKLDGRIKFLGYVNEEQKENLYSNAFAFLFVSEYEGFGVPLLEASGYGIPVITSKTSSMQEIAENAAILVNPYNYNEIANAIIKLDNFEYWKEISYRQKNMLKKYTWENAYLQFIKILSEIGKDKESEVCD